MPAAQANGTRQTFGRPAPLSEVQWEMIELCVRAAKALGIPKSVGEIFGFIFSAISPVTFDDIVQGLGISSGSASHGLRFLRRLGAVKVSFYARDRRDFFQAETSFQKLVAGYLKENVFSRLGGLAERLNGLQRDVAAGVEPESRIFAERVSLLHEWNLSAGAAFTAALNTLNR